MNIPLPAGEYLDKANQIVYMDPRMVWPVVRTLSSYPLSAARLDKANQIVYMNPKMVWLVVRTLSSHPLSEETKLDTLIVPGRPVQRGRSRGRST